MISSDWDQSQSRPEETQSFLEKILAVSWLLDKSTECLVNQVFCVYITAEIFLKRQ